MQPNQKLVVFICGLPVTGKTFMAGMLLKLLAGFYYPGIRHVDIDDTFRTPLMGVPPGNDGTDPEINKRDVAEMSESWNGMFWWMERAIQREWSYVFTGTLSSKPHGQDRLWAIRNRHPEAIFRIIHCHISMDDPEALKNEVTRRLTTRTATYTGGTRSYERWVELRARYHPIEIPHCAINTASKPSAETAFRYIVEKREEDTASWFSA